MADGQVTTQDILEAIKRAKKEAPAMPAMEGANIALGGLGRGIKHTAEDLYERMKRGVTQGPYSSPTGELDPRMVTLGPEVMLPAFGRGLGLGAAGGKIRAKQINAVPSMSDRQLEMVKELHNQGHSLKKIANHVEGLLGDGGKVTPYMVRKALDDMGLKPYMGHTSMSGNFEKTPTFKPTFSDVPIGTKLQSPAGAESLGVKEFLSHPSTERVVQSGKEN